jgi:hypothetical protein
MERIGLNETDFNVRLQLSQCCIGTLTNELVNAIKIGSKDIECKLIEVRILQNMIKYIKCYDLDSEDNCITECELLKMFDYISTKCETCFQYPGFKYT